MKKVGTAILLLVSEAGMVLTLFVSLGGHSVAACVMAVVSSIMLFRGMRIIITELI